MNEKIPRLFKNARCALLCRDVTLSYKVINKIHDLGCCELEPFTLIDNFFDKIMTDKKDLLVILEDDYLGLNDSTRELIIDTYRSGKILVLQSSEEKNESQGILWAQVNDFFNFQTETFVNEYYQVKIAKVIKMQESPCDLYIKISSTNFIKLIHKGDEYSSDIAESYWKKSVDSLYIKMGDVDLFYSAISKSIIKKLKDKTDRHKSLSKVLVQSLDLIYKNAGSLKLTDSLVVKVIESVQDSILMLKNDTDLKKMKANVLNQPLVFTHCLLTAMVASLIVDEIEWGTSNIKEKIVAAAVLHDIGHTDKVFIRHEFNAEEMSFLASSSNEFRMHPVRGGEIAEKYSSIDDNTVSIIKQHHENGAGTGFPNKLNNKSIIPVSAVFILAESFTNFILNTEKVTKDHLSLFLDSIVEENKVGNFKDAYNGLVQIIKEVSI